MKKREQMKELTRLTEEFGGYDKEQQRYFLGYDISTSVTALCLINQDEKVIVLDGIKLTSTSLTNMWEKADRVIREAIDLVGDIKIEKIFVEANAKMFSTGFSSADTLLTLAKFNGLISYLSYKAFNAEVIDVNVTAARKAVGFNNTRADKRPVKEKVFEHIVTLHPDLPWKKHVALTGKHKGQEVFNTECKDMCDAFVIALGGKRITKI